MTSELITCGCFFVVTMYSILLHIEVILALCFNVICNAADMLQIYCTVYAGLHSTRILGRHAGVVCANVV